MSPVSSYPPAPPATLPGVDRRFCAGFWRRSFALVVDLIILAVVLLSVHFLSRWIFDIILSNTVLDPAGRIFDRMNTLFLILDQGAKSAIGLFYFVFLEWSGLGGTIGKRLTGCRVTDKSGNRIGLVRAFLRNLLKPVSTLPCFLGLLMAAFMPQKQALHDLLSGSRVQRR